MTVFHFSPFSILHLFSSGRFVFSTCVSFLHFFCTFRESLLNVLHRIGFLFVPPPPPHHPRAGTARTFTGSAPTASVWPMCVWNTNRSAVHTEPPLPTLQKMKLPERCRCRFLYNLEFLWPRLPSPPAHAPLPHPPFFPF